MGRWRSWLSHLSNTQKVLSSNLGRLIAWSLTAFFCSRGQHGSVLCTASSTTLQKVVDTQIQERASSTHCY